MWFSFFPILLCNATYEALDALDRQEKIENIKKYLDEKVPGNELRETATKKVERECIMFGGNCSEIL